MCYKIENGNGEWGMCQRALYKSIKLPKSTNGSSTQWENPAPVSVPQLAPKQKSKQVHR